MMRRVIVNIDAVNNLAFDALEKGDFLTAQKLFRENCNCGDYRTLNNFGFFCIENGVERQNGQVVSGIGYGKRYIKRAYELKENWLILSNMALLARYEMDYKSAFDFYKKAYEQKNDIDILYNMSACLYETNQYKAVMDLLKESNLTAPDFFLLYLFSALKEDRGVFASILNENDVRSMRLDPDIILVILYLYNKNKIALEDIDNYLNEWSPDKYMWAVVIDSLIYNNVSVCSIKEMIDRKTEGYTSENKLKKSALSFLNSSAEQRRIYIESTPYYKPVFRDTCGYFGCPIHNTEWE